MVQPLSDISSENYILVRIVIYVGITQYNIIIIQTLTSYIKYIP